MTIRQKSILRYYPDIRVLLKVLKFHALLWYLENVLDLSKPL